MEVIVNLTSSSKAHEMIQQNDVQIRNVTFEDLEPLVNYWTQEPKEFWVARGVDPSKLKTKAEFLHSYTSTLTEKGDLRHACIIEFQGKAIGNHSLTDLVENDHGVFHARNIGANRLKEKIGIPCLGDTIFDAPILIAPLEANLYELDQDLLKALKKKYHITE